MINKFSIWFLLDNCEELCESDTCDENAKCTSNTTFYCTCNEGFIGNGTKGNCEKIQVTTEPSCNTGMLYQHERTKLIGYLLRDNIDTSIHFSFYII